VTVVFGVLLIALGLYGKLSTGTPSPTPLIPAAAGAVFVVLGLLALKESLLKHAMHAAALLGLIGLIGSAMMVLPKLEPLLAGAEIKRADGSDATLAVRLQAATGVLCAVFVALCINSFIQARRRRRAAAAGPVSGP